MSIYSRVRDYLTGADLGPALDRKWSLQVGGGSAPPDYGSAWLSDPLELSGVGSSRGGSVDFEREVGDPLDNSVVAIGIQWIMRMFPQARFTVGQHDDDDLEPIPDHPLTLKLRRPNPYYSGAELWQVTAATYALKGNAYWLKHRNKPGMGGVPIEIYWEHPATIMPYRDGKDYLTGYKIYRDNEWRPIPKEDVVHFRFGKDPRNELLGLSQLAALIREMYTDNEAAYFSATMLKNLGVPGVLISPKGDVGIVDPEKIKAAYIEKTTGKKRGEPLVVTDPLDVNKLALSPADMDVVALRTLPVERIPAALGLHRLVVGLGADATFANMEQADEWGYEHCILPMQAAFAQAVELQLLPDFSANADQEECYFDTSAIPALQEDHDALSVRVRAEWDDGLLTQNQSLIALGREEVPGGDVYKIVTREGIEFVANLEEYMAQKAADEEAKAQADQEARDAALQRLQANNNQNQPNQPNNNQNNPPNNQNNQPMMAGANANSAENQAENAQGSGNAGSGEAKSLFDTPEYKELNADRPKRVERLVASGHTVMRKAFRAQGERVMARLKELIDEKADPGELKVAAIYNPQDERAHMKAAYETAFVPALAGGVQHAQRALAAVKGLSLEALQTKRTAPPVEDVLGSRVTALDRVSQKLLASEIRDGVAAGYTLDQIAFGVEKDGYAGVKGLFEEWSFSRAYTVAQTEVSYAWNRAGLSEYRAAGEEKVLVSDGTESDEECASANGQTWWIQDAEADPMGHPNCQRQFLPLPASAASSNGD